MLRPGGPCVPNAVPIEGHTLGIRNQPIGTRPGRIDLKEIASATISIGVQHNANGIVGQRLALLSHRFVPSHGVNRESIRVWVFAFEAEVNAIAANDDADLCLVWSYPTRFRRLLHQSEDRSLAPLSFLQAPVEYDRRRIVDQSSRSGIVLGESPIHADGYKDEDER